MDDSDTSHLQSPDAPFPSSSLANDLKIQLTYSKGLTASCGAQEGQFKRQEVRDSWAYIKNPFLFFRHELPQTSATGFHYTRQDLGEIKVRDMCLTLGPNCSLQSEDDN